MKTGHGRSSVGIILIVLGLIFISDNFFLFPFEIAHYIFHWHTIMLIVGLLIVMTSRDKTFGLILCLVGGFFTASMIFHYPAGYMFRQYWPLILVLAGLWIIFRNAFNFNKTPENDSSPNSSGINSDDYLEIVNIFGGGDKRVTSQNFKGGNVTSLFGGGDIDFTDAKLAKGETVVDFVTIFGGNNVIVPPNWKVSIRVTSIFGGFSDKRRRISEEGSTSENILVIKGVFLFGGGELKN